MRPRLAHAVLILLVAFAAAPVSAPARDADYERLAASFDALAADPKLAPLAPMQMERARVSLQALKEASRGDRLNLVYVTERRIEIARTSADAALAENERAGLQRENDRLQLEAARRDAAQARQELERQRLEAQIRAEEAERLAQEAESARAEGEQASQAAEAARAEAAQSKRIADAQAKAAALAKKEAELAGGGTAASAPVKETPSSSQRMTLADSAFVRGHSGLSDSGSARIGAIVDFVNASPGSRIHIAVTVGGDRALASARAEALRDALVAAGVAAARIETTGSAKGKSRQAEIRLERAR